MSRCDRCSFDFPDSAALQAHFDISLPGTHPSCGRCGSGCYDEQHLQAVRSAYWTGRALSTNLVETASIVLDALLAVLSIFLHDESLSVGRYHIPYLDSVSVIAYLAKQHLASCSAYDPASSSNFLQPRSLSGGGILSRFILASRIARRVTNISRQTLGSDTAHSQSPFHRGGDIPTLNLPPSHVSSNIDPILNVPLPEHIWNFLLSDPHIAQALEGFSTALDATVLNASGGGPVNAIEGEVEEDEADDENEENDGDSGSSGSESDYSSESNDTDVEEAIESSFLNNEHGQIVPVSATNTSTFINPAYEQPSSTAPSKVKPGSNGSLTGSSALTSLKTANKYECPLCLEPSDDLSSTRCGHIFCTTYGSRIRLSC